MSFPIDKARILEQALMEEVSARWSKKNWWKDFGTIKGVIDQYGRPRYQIHLHPSDGPLRFRAEGGPTVHIYIYGLQYYGGQGQIFPDSNRSPESVIRSKSFWNMLENMMKQVPRLHKFSALVPVDKIREWNEENKKVLAKRFRFDPSKILKIVPPDRVQILHVECIVTAKDKDTGAVVTIKHNSPYRNSVDLIRDAQLELTRHLQNVDLLEIDGK